MIQILENITFKFAKKLIGVDIFVENDTPKISYVLLTRQKDTVEIEKQQSNIKSIEALKKETGKNIPLFISINGRSIIHKEYIPDSENLLELQIIRKAIPGVDIDTIYYQVVKNAESNSSYISCIRKDIVDNIIASLKEEGFFIAGLQFGPFSILNLTSHLNEKKIVTSNYAFSTENIATSIEYTDKEEISEHTIGDQRISGKVLVPYSVGISGFASALEIGRNFSEKLIKLREEFVFFFMFQRFAIGALGTLFFILLLNYIVYSNKAEKLAAANSYMAKNRGILEQIDAFDAEIRKKEAYLFDNKILHGTRFSYYTDRIGAKLPTNLRLTEVYLKPPQKKLQENVKINFENIVVINGIGSAKSLNQFTSNLKGEDWVSDVDVLNIKSTKNTKTINFSIQVMIKTKDNV